MSVLSQAILWDCKQCHHFVTEEDSVAFHLIGGFLYGWCRPCFNEAAIKRTQQQTPKSEINGSKSSFEVYEKMSMSVFD